MDKLVNFDCGTSFLLSFNAEQLDHHPHFSIEISRVTRDCNPIITSVTYSKFFHLKK